MVYIDELAIPAGRGIRVGLDVGGTKTEAVALGTDGSVRARVRTPTGRGDDKVVETVLAAVDEVRREAELDRGEIESVGIGIPGLVEPGTGRVLHAVNLEVSSLDLGGAVGHRLGVPVAVENDVKAAALGAGALRGDMRSLAYLNLGTGVAAGIVVEGELWRGARGTAGEVGHISVDPHGRICGCGQRGCVETFCGGGAVARAWDRPGSLPIRDIYDAADAGDAHARELREGIAFGTAAAVRIIVLGADVETVIIGGGITALGRRLFDDVVVRLREESSGSAFLASLRLDERIELLPLGSPAAALGAALIGAAARNPLVHGPATRERAAQAEAKRTDNTTQRAGIHG
ncbi:ROK family protein [Microbacterium pseudoresistens]|uniref:Putative NBD/HSP70 family sugar kinase n=1 Tax=Microbacterium pseudoresistens TaxID=640634 RepID=A0A7Y9JLY9_9MICO|nr:ROK family protein [Microbacterium pseudoresistens]NYD53421.1 putative NBD/HSP70 family sugar kinase [Microbacterium pseudoresistens]